MYLFMCIKLDYGQNLVSSMKIILALFTVLLASQYTLAQGLYFPPNDTDDWETVSAQSLGWSQDGLNNLFDYLDGEQTEALLILKDGRLVVEQYFNGFTSDSIGPWFSAGKSLQAFMIGILQEQGMLSISQPSSTYLGTGWSSLTPEQEALVTVRNHLSMSTGLDERFGFASTSPLLLRYRADAGTRWYYHNSPYNLVSDMIEAVSGMTLNAFTNQFVETPIGMNGFWLPSGSNNFYISTARDMARFGLLVLNNGVWDQTTVLGDTDYFQQMTSTSQQLNPAYGYLWWLNGKQSHILPGAADSFNGYISPDAPSDAILAAGAQGQFISVVPSQNLILIRMGKSDEESLAPVALHNEIWRLLQEAIGVSVSTDDEEEIPGTTLLEQNYPNPFNPTTTIQYNLPTAGQVRLSVFNILGQEVDVLVNSTQSSGAHTVNFDASNLSSGIYLYQLRTADVVLTRRMTLIK